MQKIESKSRSVRMTDAVIQKAAEPAQIMSGIESQLRDLESRCHTLRESFENINRQLWPVLDLMSPPMEYSTYVGIDAKCESSSSTAPYESRLRDINSEMASLESCLDDLRMRLRV